MLRLAAPTDPAWTGRALAHLDEILLDHAHLEKKAAGAAVTLLFRYPERRALQAPLARLAREELAHFEEVLGHLDRRGIPFRPQRPGAYAGRLHAAVRPDEPARLLDTLLVAALIEARSCERMGLLAEALPGVDDALARLYRGLLAAEARHHGEYVGLALAHFPEAEVRERLASLAAHEAEALAAAAPAPRLHG
ncbi:MAG: tRNA-(ms[2]io[6]A)-hydroxylase [Deltaproteobacteria bacterium]|nr:tRNA-(ms[2]io[6]A)-hydroxylase [Deltaproteobacteria bacterium]